MNSKRVIMCALICGIIAFAASPVYSGPSDASDLASMPARNASGPYDGERRIADALKIAKQEGKRVLVQSSAQGCGWCHICHDLLMSNPQIQAKIKSDFVYVLVDTTNDGNRDFYKKYANGTDHTLVLAVLESDGKELTQSIGFDIVQPDPDHPGQYHITPEHIMDFLNQWSKKS
jgi:thioredoxin-related protein